MADKGFAPMTVFRRGKTAVRRPPAALSFWYAKTGRNAPKLVQLCIAQFRQLPEGVRSRMPLLFWLLGSSTAPYKFTQPESGYGPAHDPVRTCGNCLSLYLHCGTNQLICSQVAGIVRVSDSCRHWKTNVSPNDFAKAQERE